MIVFRIILIGLIISAGALMWQEEIDIHSCCEVVLISGMLYILSKLVVT